MGLFLRSLRRASAWLLLAGFGAAQAQPAASEPGPAPRNTVGVVMLAGDQLNLLRIGALVFGNARGQVEVPDGGIADALYRMLQTDAEREPGQAVRRVAVESSAFKALARRAREGVGGWFGKSIGGMDAELAAWRRACDCQQLLVATASIWMELLGTNQTARGLTLLQLSPESSRLVIPLDLFLYDAATGKQLGHSHAGVMSSPIAFDWPKDASSTRELPAPVWQAVAAAAADIALDNGPLAIRAQRPDRNMLTFSLHDLGLRPSCDQALYLMHTTATQRDPNHAGHVPPPAPKPGQDPSSCS